MDTRIDPLMPRNAVYAKASWEHLQFASGGDIVEFADFRFDEARLHDFHENIVAPALRNADLADGFRTLSARVEALTAGPDSGGGPLPAAVRYGVSQAVRSLTLPSRASASPFNSPWLRVSLPTVRFCASVSALISTVTMKNTISCIESSSL